MDVDPQVLGDGALETVECLMGARESLCHVDDDQHRCAESVAFQYLEQGEGIGERCRLLGDGKDQVGRGGTGSAGPRFRRRCR